MSGFSVLKYYQLNINYSVNILNECLCILIDCSQLSKTYYNVLFGSSTPRSSCTTHISADVFGGRKSLVKPVTRQKTCNNIELFGSSTADVQRITLNALCMTISIGRKNQTTRYILSRHWLYE